MNYSKLFSIWLILLNSVAFGAAPKITLQAEDGKLSEARTEIVEQQSFKSGAGVALKQGSESNVESAAAEPDLTLLVTPAQAGRYEVVTHAAVDAEGKTLMDKAKTKHESMFLKIAVGDAPPTKRVVFVPWSGPDSCFQTLGKFDLAAQEQEVQVWLPGGVRLDYIEFKPYQPPAVPTAAANYKPAVTPPASRPRLWVNEQSLSAVKANLTKGENAPLWQKVQDAAGKPYEFNVEPGERISHDSKLESAAVNKAFVYLMTGNEKSGREAVELVHGYLAAVEFGNLLDITREIGRAIYAGARVYDWCYDVMSEDERRDIRNNMMRLADDMEIGWPPFKQGVVNGHGSEAQLHCHLLSMAIAIYDEDPVPYQYCAYRVLEELVPMRNFEYQSPRHNQGIGYGIYRFGWDLHAAWLFYRMSGEKVFDSNIEDVHKYWLYMRLPNGQSFPDGDGNVDGRRINLGTTALLAGAYAEDPIMKREFLQQGGLPHDPILVLLVNNPELKPAEDLSSLPLTIDFGPILGGTVARTGWDIRDESSDVVVAMTGGGYHFGNHQHADAGSFQVYYHGPQITDLGQYVFYGTPYDMNFNKRSIAHSMMLAYDADEKFAGGNRLNDGGARFEHSVPKSPQVVTKDPRYANGHVISADFGPSPDHPAYSYFSVDLASAYSDKIDSYRRTFCFLNLDNKQTPAALLVLDNMKTSSPDTRKYWQINTLNKPRQEDDRILLTSSEGGKTGYVSVRTLLPTAENREMEILSGKDANSVFGHELQPPKPDGPQANGHRIMISPVKAQTDDTFLTLMLMSEEADTTEPVQLTETPEAYMVTLQNNTVLVSKTGELLKGLSFDLEEADSRNVILTGLAPGTWNIRDTFGQFEKTLQIEEKKNTAFVTLQKGNYTLELAK